MKRKTKYIVGIIILMFMMTSWASAKIDLSDSNPFNQQLNTWNNAEFNSLKTNFFNSTYINATYVNETILANLDVTENLTVDHNITAYNITANGFFIGDGSLLTGLPSGFTFGDWFNQNLNDTADVAFNKVTSTFHGDGGNITNISLPLADSFGNEDFEDDTDGSAPTEDWYSTSASADKPLTSDYVSRRGNKSMKLIAPAHDDPDFKVKEANYDYIEVWYYRNTSGGGPTNNDHFYVTNVDYDWLGWFGIGSPSTPWHIFGNGTDAYHWPTDPGPNTYYKFNTTVENQTWLRFRMDFNWTTNRVLYTVENSTTTEVAPWWFSFVTPPNNIPLSIESFYLQQSSGEDVYIDDIFLYKGPETTTTSTSNFTYSDWFNQLLNTTNNATFTYLDILNDANFTGNVSMDENLSVTKNITGYNITSNGFFKGDGSLLTGLPSGFTYSDWFNQLLNTTNNVTHTYVDVINDINVTSIDCNEIDISSQILFINASAGGVIRLKPDNVAMGYVEFDYRADLLGGSHILRGATNPLFISALTWLELSCGNGKEIRFTEIEGSADYIEMYRDPSNWVIGTHGLYHLRLKPTLDLMLNPGSGDIDCTGSVLGNVVNINTGNITIKDNTTTNNITINNNINSNLNFSDNAYTIYPGTTLAVMPSGVVSWPYRYTSIHTGSGTKFNNLGFVELVLNNVSNFKFDLYGAGSGTMTAMDAAGLNYCNYTATGIAIDTNNKAFYWAGDHDAALYFTGGAQGGFNFTGLNGESTAFFSVVGGGSMNLQERTSDPPNPIDGHMVIWMSDGTGKGSAGDILIASNQTGAGNTKWTTIFDYSAGANW